MLEHAQQLAQLKAGNIYALRGTTASGQRQDDLLSTRQDAPQLKLYTVAQSGFADFEVLAWYALYGPRGLPQEAVSRLTAELGRIMAEPATVEKLVQLGAEPKFLTGEAFADFSRRELDKWGRVIRASGASAE